MSVGQLSLLKKLADDQEFGIEVSVTPEEVENQSHKENNDETSSYPSSLVKEDEKSYSDEEEEEEERKDEDETRDEDSDDDESSYESTDTSDGTEDIDSSSSELPQSSSDVTIKESAEKSLNLEEPEGIAERRKEESKSLESSNKNAKSVSFDGICKSKKTASTEGSSNMILTPDILTVDKDSSPGQKKIMRQEHINLGGSDENIASVSMHKTNSLSSVNANESVRTSKESSSGHSRRNPSMRIPCQETSSNLETSSSQLSSIKESRKKKRNGWTPPVSADERLDQNYRELYQLLTRDVEVKGEARQLVHAYQMEQLYDRYVSVSHGFVKRTYVMPRSVLSVRDDSRFEKVRTTKCSMRSRSPSKSNQRSSQQSGKNSSQTLNDHPPLGNSSLSSARYVDHRHGQNSNPDILKWLQGKNHMFFKQKREERAQRQLQKETKRQETLLRAERRLQSQQAVYNWMQQKLKEYQLSSSEEKKKREKKLEMRKTKSGLRRDIIVEDRAESKNGEQNSTQTLSSNPAKVKGHLKPLQDQIKKNKENKASVKSEHFKHMESTLSYDAWTRQTGKVGCRKVVNNCADFKSDNDASIRFHKKIGKGEESFYSAADKEYSAKEDEDESSLQKNGTDLKPKEEESSPQKKSIRPKTAYGSRVRQSADFSFDATSEKNGKVRSLSEKNVNEASLSELNENESKKFADSDLNDSGNENK